MEWSGADGVLGYYDKEAKQDMVIGDNFKFLLLDSLSTITGYHKPSNSGIVSNEVRDTRKDEMHVRAFKGGPIAQGHYQDIKDRVKAAGGKFTTSLYVGYMDTKGLAIGCIQLTGAALSAWMDFSKEHRAQLDSHGVQINGVVEGQNGSIKYKVPKFGLMSIKPETNQAAIDLDAKLQEYLNGYLSRTKADDTNQDTRTEDYSQERDQSHEYGDEDIDDDYSRNQSKPTLTQPIGGVNLADDDIPF